MTSEAPLEKMKRNFPITDRNERYRKCMEILCKKRVLVGGFDEGITMLFSIKSMRLVRGFHFHDACVTAIAAGPLGHVLSADLAGVLLLSRFDEEKDTFDSLFFIFSYVGEKILKVEFCRHDPLFFLVNTGRKVEVRSVNNPGEKLFLLRFEFCGSFPELSLPLPSEEQRNPTEPAELKDIPNEKLWFENAVVSFGNVPCVVVYGFSKGVSKLLSFGLDGMIIGKYEFFEDVGSELVHLMIIKDEFFNDVVVACDAAGNFFFFDLPFFDNGRKNKSNQGGKIEHIVSLNDDKALLLVDEKGTVSFLSCVDG